MNKEKLYNNWNYNWRNEMTHSKFIMWFTNRKWKKLRRLYKDYWYRKYNKPFFVFILVCIKYECKLWLKRVKNFLSPSYRKSLKNINTLKNTFDVEPGNIIFNYEQ